MTDADTIAYELATASAERRHQFARELAALRELASCAAANRRRLPRAVEHKLRNVPGGARTNCLPPEPPAEAGTSQGIF